MKRKKGREGEEGGRAVFLKHTLEHAVRGVGCTYQTRHALKHTQDLRVTQHVVGEVEDTEPQTLAEVLNVCHGLQAVVGYLQCVQDREAGWRGGGTNEQQQHVLPAHTLESQLGRGT